jgi:hypothetical protein
MFKKSVAFGDITQHAALVLVLAERKRQDKKWGANRHLSNLLWNAILSEEFGEAAKEVLEKDDEKLLAELSQVAAVALAWMEDLIATKETEDAGTGEATS